MVAAADGGDGGEEGQGTAQGAEEIVAESGQ